MRRFLRTAVAFAVWVIGSLSIAHTWVTNPDVFPTLPMPLWNWLDSIYRSRNAEEVTDLEFFVVLTLSSLVLLLCVAVSIIIWRLLKNKALTPGSTGRRR